MFKKVLIANRGEIALRLMRAAKELGIETAAMYHSVDIAQPFVHFADCAYELKSETPKSAYLDIEQIVELAQRIGAEAIHPGYGFLSERSEFAKAVTDAGIKFIGPTTYAIEVMGSKTKARELMAAAGVPIVPGTKEKISEIDRAFEIAEMLRYPILLKAAAGGGGKGMRKIDSENELKDGFDGAKREALKAFGDDSIYMEKFIENPKHIEIQVIADEHGNYAHIGERDCSIQRRHQKVIEEAPSTVLDDNLRNKMGEVAINAAKAVGYFNAGTIEFLLDKNKDFYFLEMNTRLQVEHPVTEMVTRINLAKEQFRIAYGNKLSFSQEDIKWIGHAIECRIYAEDPFSGFMPTTGKIKYMREPAGYGIRVDSGIDIGSEVSIHFDPLLAKLVAWGKDRQTAIERMEYALKSYIIKGVRTAIPFEIAVMQNDIFKNGYFDTGFIDKHFDWQVLDNLKSTYEELVAGITAFGYRLYKDKKLAVSINSNDHHWKTIGRARNLR